MNQFEKKTFPIKELPSGDQLNLTIYRIKGDKLGPHVHIQSSVHGAELQGNLVIMEMLRYLQNNPINGSMTLIPMANPQATNTKFGTTTQGRFNPITGNNWNRNYSDISSKIDYKTFIDKNMQLEWKDLKNEFKKEIFNQCNFELNSNDFSIHGSENKKLNLILQKIASTADIILDLHTGPKACRYLYSAEYQKTQAKDLYAPYTIIIPNEFAGAMDEACFMPWINLHKHLAAQNKEINPDVFSFTVELGNEEEVSSMDATNDCKRILKLLHAQKVVNEKPVLDEQQQYWSELSNYHSYFSPCGGLFEPKLKPGQQFKIGDVLGKIHCPRKIMNLDAIEEAVISIKALHNAALINHTPTTAIGEGMEMIQVLADLKRWD